MKFGEQIQKRQIPEWKDAYLNYEILKLYLKPFKHLKRMKFDKALTNTQHTDNQVLFSRTEQLVQNSFIVRNQHQITKLKKEVEDTFLQMFYSGPMNKEGQRQLRMVLEEKEISQGSTFFFGFFTGFSIFFFFWIIILFAVGTLDPNKETIDGEPNTFKYIFPMFRGCALLILAMWLIGVNVYAWSTYHVNYKLIFKFSSHYSNLSQILKRAAGFTIIFLFFFIWYILLLTNDPDMSQALDWINEDVCPLLVWIMILVYILNPVKNIMNHEGRRYLWTLLFHCLAQPFEKMEFRIAWMTDQLISLVGAIKDFEYTLCYWIQQIFGKDTATCTDSKRPTGFLASLIPLYYRAVQCSRQIYEDYTGLPSIYKHPQFINLGKYLSSILTSILSYYTKYNESLEVEVLWIISAAISTVYSYIWDLKKDWGLLEPGQKGLRSIKQYKDKLYYFAIFSNLLLRLVWVLSISPDILSQLEQTGITNEIFTFFVYALEALRRCQWNLFRVENEHVRNFQNFKAVRDLQLPLNQKIEVDDEESQEEENEHLVTQAQNGEKFCFKQEKLFQQHKKEIKKDKNKIETINMLSEVEIDSSKKDK
ncbi:hypothetical protein PPERSA_10266 [Pseudocohnilembus persalinus]|uniref:EXS domain-containing protein n=1 Tax=Pseudocohnilembus persalinus TaxID=266149 RepID=A0A0V0R019_PSEPJ|nr:hypothetical protein PPERSA_10266 [Pseudocohnilembus persalinus]|eukprot:KRX07878.1 hypothetical protein PPERSA_10266 [Pseudocohnilembus persalinus]